MVMERAKKMWRVKEQISKDEELNPYGSTSCPSASILFLSGLNSFSSEEQYKVLILLEYPSVPQNPHLFESLYRNRDYRYRHLRSYTYTRARLLWRGGTPGPRLVRLPVRFAGALEVARFNTRRRAEKGEGGEGGPFVGERAALIGRRISGRVEDGRDERGGGHGSFLGPRRVRVEWWRLRASFGGFSEVKRV